MQEEVNTNGGQAGSKIKGMLINVTTAIIETAMPENSSHCMIADAVKAAAVNKNMRISKVIVDVQSIRFTDRSTGRRYVCWTPLVGQQAIQLFDQGVKPDPFTFRLKPVQIIEKHQRRQKAAAGAPGKGYSKPKMAVPAKSGYGQPIKLGGKPIATMGLRRVFGIRQLGMVKPILPVQPVQESVTE